MKKNVLVFGLIAGLIVSIAMFASMAFIDENGHYEGSMVVGYAAMIVAFAFVFVGIKNYRDKYQDGIISFGKAFKVGFLISLIASTMYVITWMLELHFFFPDFMEKYTAQMMADAQNSGLSQTELTAKSKEMDSWKEMYKNPLLVVLMTYAEILPVGLLVTLISAALLKRKGRAASMSMG